MPENKPPPEIFDARLLSLRRSRAGRRERSFLFERTMDDAAERLQDVNRQFQSALIVGSRDTETYIKAQLPTDKCPAQLQTVSDISETAPTPDYDLILSLLSLQSVNDIIGTMIRMRQILKPDGLFIAAMFGGDTLTELRQALYKTDEAMLGGMSARVYPMASYSQAGNLLSRAGLNQPIVDTDRFSVSYSDLDKLINDLRDLGETNVLTARSRSALPREYRTMLEKYYHESFSREDGKLTASFEIMWMTGWAPHDSQQKPLKPGSAKMRLADALKTEEKKL